LQGADEVCMQELRSLMEDDVTLGILNSNYYFLAEQKLLEHWSHTTTVRSGAIHVHKRCPRHSGYTALHPTNLKAYLTHYYTTE
jgi:hypothetical protein